MDFSLQYELEKSIMLCFVLQLYSDNLTIQSEISDLLTQQV